MNYKLVLALCFCFTLTNANPKKCEPLCFDEKKVSCEKLGKPVPVGGGLYTNWELHYNVMLSPYYAAQMFDALGYKCCKTCTILKGMNLVTPWSGTHGAIAIDGLYGFNRNVLRICQFPTNKYPFICKFSNGPNCAPNKEHGTLSYISLLHDEKRHKWTLFGHCWNPKTPQNPNAVPTATSFNVFSLEDKLSKDDKKAILAKLKELGFRTDNIIEPNFTGNPAPLKC